MRRLRRSLDQSEYLVAALPVMLNRLRDPGPVSAERRTVPRQYEFHVQTRHAIQRLKELGQHVAARMPRDVRRAVLQALIAGEKKFSYILVHLSCAEVM